MATPSRRTFDFMGNDLRNSTIRLGQAAVAFQRGMKTARFKVHTASLNLVPGRRPVRLRLEGARGSVLIELSRTAFWRLTAEFHEQSIAAADVSSEPRARRNRS